MQQGAGLHVGSLADIRGEIHAFSDPDSNFGYLVTTAALAAMGTSPQTFFGRSDFTYGHRNVVRAVASGLPKSGSVGGYVWEALTVAEPPRAIGRCEIAAGEVVLARDVVVIFRPGVNVEDCHWGLRQKFRSIR